MVPRRAWGWQEWCNRDVPEGHMRVSAEGGAADWKVVPAWTREKAISAYFGNDPRLLANHGLCNAKFHRVVLCQPGWQTGNPDECSYLVCSGYYSSLFGKEEREAYERDFPAKQ